MPVIFQSSWDVVEKPIYSNNQVLSGYKAIFRSDTNHLLNVCKDSYTPTTNERFMEVVQKMNDITGFPVKCFDEFDGGKKVLAFLQCTEPIQVGGHSFEDYLMIGNSHDSSTGRFAAAIFYGQLQYDDSLQKSFLKSFPPTQSPPYQTP